MSNLVPVISLGFTLGLAHAADADHVAAVSTMVGDKRSAPFAWAARLGGLWAAGHTASVLLVGGLMIAFRAVVPDALSHVLELAVAVMLVALGASTLRAPPAGGHAERRGLRSLGVGVLHGLAGSAAVGLAVLSRTSSPVAGLGYLACFGVGTLAGMSLLTVAMALPFVLLGKRPSLGLWLRRAAGAASIGVGLFLFATVLGDWLGA